MTVDITFTHDTYLSPFTWRYGSREMRQVWSEAHRRRLWRRIWVALADAEQAAGLVTAEQVADLRSARGRDRPGARAGDRGGDPPRSDGRGARLRRAVPGRRADHPPGRHLDGHRGQRGGPAPARGARPAAGEAAEAAAGVRRADRGVGRCADDGLHPPPARRADDDRLPAGAVCPGFVGRLAGADAASGAELRGKGFKGAVGTSASYAQLLS